MADPSHPVALVVGGASGIGKATAVALAGEGYRVVVNTARSVDLAEAVAANLDGAVAIQAQMGRRSEADRLVDEVLRRCGRLDVVVYSAGATQWIPYADLDAVDENVWEEVLGVNLLGPWWVARAAASPLRTCGDGSFVVIGSLAGTQAGGSSIPYAVSKAAVHHLCTTLASALAPEVRVNAVAPGFVATPWTSSASALRTSMEAKAPLRRVGQPSDVADAILGLLGIRYITGQVLLVDGGFSTVP